MGRRHMKKECMKKLILLWSLLTLTACGEKGKDVTGAIINDKQDFIIQGETCMSSFIEVKNIIPLETSDVCLISSVEKIIKRNGIIYVKSKNRPLLSFNEDGKFLNAIGTIGIGPQQYVQVADFDVKGNHVYVLTSKKIQVYTQGGEWIKSIPITLNASNLRLSGDEMLLFVLGNKHVIHVVDMEGKEKKSDLKRNQALRLNRAIAFIPYGESMLFPMGRSNELLAYNTRQQEFSIMNFLESNSLTNKRETELMEESPRYNRQLQQIGCFDGLLTDNTHMIVPYIKENDVTLWIKNLQNSQCRAYRLSDLRNDITYVSASSFFYDNTEDDKGFLTYIMPYQLKEGLAETSGKKNGSHFERMQHVLEALDEEANPILIEYKIKM